MAPDLPDRSDFEAEIEAAIEKVFEPVIEKPATEKKTPSPPAPEPEPKTEKPGGETPEVSRPEPILELIPEEEKEEKPSGKVPASSPNEAGDASGDDFISLSLEEIAPQEEIGQIEEITETDEAEPASPTEGEKKPEFVTLLEPVEASILALDWEVSPRYLEEFKQWLERLKAFGGPVAEIAALMDKAAQRLKDPSKATPETMALLYRALGLLKALSQGKDISKGLEKLQKELGETKAPPPETPEGIRDLLELQSNILKKCLHLIQTFERLFRKARGLDRLAETCAQMKSEIEFALSIAPEWIDIDLEVSGKNLLLPQQGPRPEEPQEEKEPEITPPDYKVIHCFAGEREFVVPEKQVGFLDKLPKRLQKKLVNNRVFKAYWLKWPFIRLNKKFRGALSQISENRLLTFSAPYIPLSPTAETVLILWDGQKGLALGIDEALEFELSPKAKLFPAEGAIGLVEIDGEKIPYYDLEHIKENFWGQDL
ncbi:hypothetical protein [Thermosulfuriphilus sp.]